MKKDVCVLYSKGFVVINGLYMDRYHKEYNRDSIQLLVEKELGWRLPAWATKVMGVLPYNLAVAYGKVKEDTPFEEVFF